jgi:hypothetical protein
MARIVKAEIYITDYEGDYEDADHILGELKSLVSNELWVDVKVGKVKESKEFEWKDDLKINQTDSTIEDLEEYLK